MSKDYQEEIDIAIANLIFAGLSIAQIEKIPKWLLESIEKNKPGFKEFVTTYGNARVEEIIKIVEGMERIKEGMCNCDLEPSCGCEYRDYNQALTDLIEAIKK